MLSKSPAKGMRDFLPKEFALRQQTLAKIQSSYEHFGFTRIETPSVENLSLLTSKQGGDNEKLIFKILKRGEKLEEASGGQLCDLGLRYDLTVPLARFYSNNAAQLPSVFKAMQMDSVWRADRPQRGRFRQFVQCDIDIIGEETNLAEIELIVATATTLNKLGFDDVTVRISDRRLLNALAEFCGFAEEEKSDVFISLDKLDKIGFDGVREEICAISPQKADKFMQLLKQIIESSDQFATCVALLGDFLPQAVSRNLVDIMSVCNGMLQNGRVVFDVTLVRGMGYYTGTIYEITDNSLHLSVAGGGRYDRMIGKIAGTDVPACGFSIGFERIVLLLQERGVQPESQSGAALLVERGLDSSQLLAVEKVCAELRQQTKVTLVKKNKNLGYQLKQLKDSGFEIIYEFKDGKAVEM